MAYLQARWQISVMSAPEKPLVCFTSRSTSTSGATGDFRNTACRMHTNDVRPRAQATGLRDEHTHLEHTAERPHAKLGSDRADLPERPGDEHAVLADDDNKFCAERTARTQRTEKICLRLPSSGSGM